MRTWHLLILFRFHGVTRTLDSVIHFRPRLLTDATALDAGKELYIRITPYKADEVRGWAVAHPPKKLYVFFNRWWSPSPSTPESTFRAEQC